MGRLRTLFSGRYAANSSAIFYRLRYRIPELSVFVHGDGDGLGAT